MSVRWIGDSPYPVPQIHVSAALGLRQGSFADHNEVEHEFSWAHPAVWCPPGDCLGFLSARCRQRCRRRRRSNEPWRSRLNLLKRWPLLAGRGLCQLCQEEGTLQRSVLKRRISRRCISTSSTWKTGLAAYSTTSAAIIFNLALMSSNSGTTNDRSEACTHRTSEPPWRWVRTYCIHSSWRHNPLIQFDEFK